MTGMRIKSAISTHVYKKSLTLSPKSRKESTSGEIVNLMSVDSSRLMDLTSYLHILWSGPLQISLALYFLYQTLGSCIFLGLLIMVLSSYDAVMKGFDDPS